MPKKHPKWARIWACLGKTMPKLFPSRASIRPAKEPPRNRQGTAKEPPRATKSNMSCTKMTFPWHHFSQGAPPRNRQGTARCKRQGNPCPKQAPTIEIHDPKKLILGTHFWTCVPKMPRSTFDKQDPLIVDQFSFQRTLVHVH